MYRVHLCLLSAVLCLLPSIALAQPLNVKAYGAVGNGSNDDTGAFVNAIAAAVALPQSAEIYIPAGTYRLTNQLSITNKSIAFRGEGQKLSILRWDNPAAGIAFSSTTSSNTSLTIKSLSLLRANYGSGTAISGSWLATPGYHGDHELVTTTIEDVYIASSPFHTNTVGWSMGIDLLNATNAKIRNFTIKGIDLGAGHSGIRFYGKSVSNYVSDGDVSHFYYGVTAWDTSEGMHIADVEIIAVVDGIHLSSAFGRPGTSVRGCHVNSTSKGIVTYQFGDVAITDNLIYKFGTGNWMGIHIIHGDSMRIIGNYIVEITPGGPSNGIVLEGSTVRNIVQSNITEGMDAGVWLVSPSVSDNIVMGNLNRVVGTSVLNNGSGNHILNNP